MTLSEVLDVSRQAVVVTLTVASPILLPALVVGLIVSLFQALTQIPEMTLSFMPKVLVIFVSPLLLLPFMVSALVAFGQSLMDRIVALGQRPPSRAGAGRR